MAVAGEGLLAAACREFGEETGLGNTFEMVWPPRSGRRQSFPEVDRAGFFESPTARHKLIEAQIPFVERAQAARGGS